MNIKLTIGLILATAGVTFGAYPDERSYIIGDIDGCTYNGPGSVDHPYVDPAFQVWVDTESTPHEPLDHVTMDNGGTHFTFAYDLAAGETIIGATLEIGLQAAGYAAQADWVVVHPDDGTAAYTWDRSVPPSYHPNVVYPFATLGWTIPEGSVGVFTLDLSDVNGDDHVWHLDDGVLNVAVTDDTGVDYAELTMTVIPEPASLSLLALGGLALLRRRRRT